MSRNVLFGQIVSTSGAIETDSMAVAVSENFLKFPWWPITIALPAATRLDEQSSAHGRCWRRRWVMDDLSRFCCLNSSCRLCGKRDAGNLYVRQRYGKQRLRLLCCRGCQSRFSERKGTPLFGSKLDADQSLSVLEHLNEG